MNEKQRKQKFYHNRKVQTWAVVAVIVFVVLLFFWTDIAELLGQGQD